MVIIMKFDKVLEVHGGGRLFAGHVFAHRLGIAGARILEIGDDIGCELLLLLRFYVFAFVDIKLLLLLLFCECLRL